MIIQKHTIPSLIFVLLLNLGSPGFAAEEKEKEKEKEEKKILSRGWVGGEYQRARAHSWFGKAREISVFPKVLKDEQSAGIFVDRVPDGTPMAKGGLKEGDLILKVNGRSVTKIARFYKEIEKKC